MEERVQFALAVRTKRVRHPELVQTVLLPRLLWLAAQH